jgi:hypothetical protein
MKFMYELTNGKIVTRKVRGSGREAAMRAAAKAPQGTRLIAKARKGREVVGTKVTDSFRRVASPTKGIVCILSEKTGKTTCVDRSAERKAKRYDRFVKEGIIPTGQYTPVSKRPAALGAPRGNPEYLSRGNPEYMTIDPRENPPRRRRGRRPSSWR